MNLLSLFQFLGRLRNALFVGAFLASSLTATAGTSYTWNGTGTSWGTSTAWTVNGVPGASDTATFDTDATAQTVNLLTNQAINGMTFSESSAAVTLDSGNISGLTLTLGTGGISQTSGGAVTIGGATTENFTLNLAGSQTWSNTSGTSMTVDANINGTATTGTQTLTTSGNAGIQLLGNIGDGSSGGKVAINWGGAGNLTLGGTNTFSGGVTMNSGAASLFLDSTTALGTGTLTINGGTIADGNSALLTLTSNNLINITGSFFVGGSHSLNLGTGNVTVTGADTISASNGATFTLGGNISGTGSITKAGTAVVQLAGANSFTGGLSVTGGALIIGNGTTGSLTGVSTVAVTGSGTFLEFNLANGGVYSGTITNASNSTVEGLTTGSNVQTLSGVISGATAKFEQNGTGTTILAATETYGGTTTFNAGGTIQLGNGITSGTLATALPTLASGDTLAFDETNGTAVAGNITNTAGTVAGVEGSGITNTLSGVISGAGAFAQTGAGTTILSGSNTYSGTTTVSAGTLVLVNAANSTETGATSVASGATLQLQNANALEYSALTLGSGSTLQLRANTASNNTTITFAPASIATLTSGTTLNFDVNNLSTGTGNTLALTGGIIFNDNANNQINVTGGNGTGLALGTITAETTATGIYTDTINATTAPVSIASFVAGAYGTNLVLEGGNNITFGSSSTPATTNTLSSTSNGYFNVNVNGAVVTIYGSYNNSSGTTGTRTLTLNSGQINFDSVNASPGEAPGASPILFTINGGLIDNTTGSAIVSANTANIDITNSFAFGGSAGSASLTLPGAVTVTNNDTITVNANTLTLNGTLNISGNTLTKAGAGNLDLGNVAFTGSGSRFANTGTGTLALGTINNADGYSIDFSTTGGAITTTSTNGNPTGLGLFLSVFDTVNNGADFAAVNGSGLIVSRNSLVSETVFTGTGGVNTKVYTLSGSVTASGVQTLGSLIINDTGTTDSLSIGTSNLTLGGGGNGGILYNGGPTGVYTINSAGGLLTGGTGHTLNINTYAGTLIISAQMIDGSGNTFDTLQKGGAGTLILTGANSFGGTSGGINLGGGTLDLGNGNTGSYAGTVGTILVGSTATLGVGLANGSTLGAPIDDNGGVVGIETSGVVNTLSGFLYGSGNLVQTGVGTTIDSAVGDSGGSSPSTYFTGAVDIDAGAIAITNAGAFGATQANHQTSGITVASGAALQIEDNITTAGAYALTLNGAGVSGAANGALENVSGANTYTGVITLASAASIGSDAGTLTASGNVINGGHLLRVIGAGNTNFSAIMSGAGGLTVNSNGSGIVTLSGGASNTYTGETVVSAGELDLDKTTGFVAILGAGAENVSTPDILVDGGVLKFLASDQLANSVDGTGDVTLSMSSGSVNLNGTSQTLYAFQNSGGTFTTGTGTLLGTGATVTFSGGTNTINDGGTVEDSHIVISGGTNTVQAGGELVLDEGGLGLVFSNGANLTLNSDNSSPGQLDVNAILGSVDISSNAASTTATISSGTGGSQAGFIDLNGDTAIITTAAGTVANGGPDLSIGAVIADGSGSGGVSKEGNGILQFTGANTYTGTTEVDFGTLNIGNGLSGSISSSSSVLVGASGTLAFDEATGATVTNAVSDSGAVTGAEGTGITNTLSGAISGGGSFTQSGAGTTDLSHANTYSGGTTVSAGELLITNTSGSATGSGLLTVGSLGTLSGTGRSVSSSFSIAGNVIAGSGLPSDTIGVTTITGAAVLGNSNFTNAKLSFNLNSANTNGTSINVGSTGVNFGNTTMSLTLQNGTAANDYQYILVAGVNSGSLGGVDGSQYTGFTTDSSGADGLQAGQYKILSGLNLSLVNSDNTGSFLFLNTDGGVDNIEVEVEGEAIPEPQTWALMMGGLGLLLFYHRRRNQVD